MLNLQHQYLPGMNADTNLYFQWLSVIPISFIQCFEAVDLVAATCSNICFLGQPGFPVGFLRAFVQEQNLSA